MKNRIRTTFRNGLFVFPLCSFVLSGISQPAYGGGKNPFLNDPKWNAWRNVDNFNETLTQMRKKVMADPVLMDFRRLKPQENSASLKVSEALDALFDPTTSDQKEKYRTFVVAFGAASRLQLHEEKKLGGSAGDTSKTGKALRQLGKILYTGTDLSEFNSRLTCIVAKEGIEKGRIPFKPQVPSSEKDTLKRFDQLRQKIDSLTQIQDGIESNRQISYFGQVGQSLAGNLATSGFDPNRESNLISVKARYTNAKNGQEVLALRMPTQTLFSAANKVVIAPEFEMYLNSLQSEGKKHTYVNYQQLNDVQDRVDGESAEEKYRARKLHDLSEQYPNLTVISLNKDSDFYKQKRSPYSKAKAEDWEEAKTFGEFKEKYLDMLVPKKDDEEKTWKETGIRLGDLWKPSKFKGKTAADEETMRAETREYFSKMLDQLGSSVFNLPLANGVTDPLAVTDRFQRRALIELSYHFISDYASRDSYSSNRTCSDSVDRGGGANALAYTMALMQEVCDPEAKMKVEEFQKRMDAIPGMLLSDALLVRKRGITEPRLVYYQDAMRNVLLAVQERGCESVFGKQGMGDFLRPFQTSDRLSAGSHSC